MLPRVIGHRGAAAYAPENTLESIREAHRRGARWVELDAKLTSDGVVVLMHDDTLDRTTNGKGPVASASFELIQALDAGGWFGSKWRNVRVPTLAATISLLTELDMGANIEIKPCPGRDKETAFAMLEVVRHCWPVGKVPPLISSFSRESLDVAWQAAPELPRGLLVWEHSEDWVAAAEQFGCVTVNCSHQHLTPEWAREIRARGYGLIVYTLNDGDRARAQMGWGVQSIITDRPDTILAAI